MEDGSTREEWKGLCESNKILNTTEQIPIDGICVRIGAMRCHSQAFTIKLKEDIPLEELQKLVKYHLVQSPWSKLQLQSLDVWGWIDTLDVNNDQPKGYKRETLLLEENRKLGMK